MCVGTLENVWLLKTERSISCNLDAGCIFTNHVSNLLVKSQLRKSLKSANNLFAFPSEPAAEAASFLVFQFCWFPTNAQSLSITRDTLPSSWNLIYVEARGSESQTKSFRDIALTVVQIATLVYPRPSCGLNWRNGRDLLNKD